MITKNFPEGDYRNFTEKLVEKLEENGFELLEFREVLGDRQPIPKVGVFTVAKEQRPFRISVVYDKNGTTITVIGLTDGKLESQINRILNTFYDL